MHAKFCMISDRPTILKIDERNRPHCESGPFCQWSDGSKIYAWHGVFVPWWFIEEKHRLTPGVALALEDVEHRRAACEILGWENVIQHPSLNPRVIDRDSNPEIGELIEINLPDSPAQWVLKYRCGTGRYFAEMINDKRYKTAAMANARGYGWTIESGDAIENYIPQVRT